MFKRVRKNQGFTLIELMIVIAIIAILMAYALPAYRQYIVRTKIAEGVAMAAAYKLAVNEAYVRVGDLAGLDNGVNGIGSSAATGHCVSNIEVLNGEITVTFDCAAGSANQANPEVLAAELVFSPVVDTTGSLLWGCTATVVRPAHSPCL